MPSIMTTNTKLDIFRGTLDDENPLSLLRANALVWSKVFENLEAIYNAHILRSTVAYKIMDLGPRVFFPPASDININMMPINACDPMPDFLEAYYPLIFHCVRFCDYDKRVLVLQAQYPQPIWNFTGCTHFRRRQVCLKLEKHANCQISL